MHQLPDLLVDFDPEDTEPPDQVLLEAAVVHHFVHRMAVLDAAHLQLHLLSAAQRPDFEVRALRHVFCRGEPREAVDLPAVHRVDDVARLQARFLRRPPWEHVGDDHAPIAREAKAGSQHRGDALRCDSELDPVHMATLAQSIVDEPDHRSRDGEAQPLATA